MLQILAGVKRGDGYEVAALLLLVEEIRDLRVLQLHFKQKLLTLNLLKLFPSLFGGLDLLSRLIYLRLSLIIDGRRGKLLLVRSNGLKNLLGP